MINGTGMWDIDLSSDMINGTDLWDIDLSDTFESIPRVCGGVNLDTDETDSLKQGLKLSPKFAMKLSWWQKLISVWLDCGWNENLIKMTRPNQGYSPRWLEDLRRHLVAHYVFRKLIFSKNQFFSVLPSGV